MTTVITDALCPFCGCTCDDITIVVEDNKIIEAKHACKLGAAKIMGHHRIKAPMMRSDKNSDFKEVSYEEAIDAAARIFAKSKRPLMYGWASTLCEVHKKGILLAEDLGAIIDNTATVCHGPSTLAVHEKGLPTSTLGQIKNRADVVVFCPADRSHDG